MGAGHPREIGLATPPQRGLACSLRNACDDAFCGVPLDANLHHPSLCAAGRKKGTALSQLRPEFLATLWCRVTLSGRGRSWTLNAMSLRLNGMPLRSMFSKEALSTKESWTSLRGRQVRQVFYHRCHGPLPAREKMRDPSSMLGEAAKARERHILFSVHALCALFVQFG